MHKEWFGINTFKQKYKRRIDRFLELLKSDMPKREESPDPDSHFWSESGKVLGDKVSRFPSSSPGAA